MVAFIYTLKRPKARSFTDSWLVRDVNYVRMQVSNLSLCFTLVSRIDIIVSTGVTLSYVARARPQALYGCWLYHCGAAAATPTPLGLHVGVKWWCGWVKKPLKVLSGVKCCCICQLVLFTVNTFHKTDRSKDLS